MTADDVVSRIRAQFAAQGILWRADTVDTFKAGRPDAPVTGIVTTGMATFDLLRRAAAAGRNFVISHEPTFYGHLDQTASLAGDAVFEAKQRFVREHDLVVFRLHDHAHALRPDPLVAGSARMLGLAPYASPTERHVYLVPPTTLRGLVADFTRRLGSRAMRVVGDPDMPVSRVGVSPGYGTPSFASGIDVAVGGEIAESGGNAEYALDAVAAGQSRGCVLLGHMMSEDWGMREVGDWLRTFLTDVPVEWMPAHEPFA